MKKRNRLVTAVMIGLLLSAAGVLLTWEDRVFFDLDSGRRKESREILFVTVGAVESETVFSGLAAKLGLIQPGGPRWVRDSSRRLWESHSPHWRHHGILSESEAIAVLATRNFPFDEDRQREFLRVAIEEFPAFCGPPVTARTEDFMNRRNLKAFEKMDDAVFRDYLDYLRQTGKNREGPLGP